MNNDPFDSEVLSISLGQPFYRWVNVGSQYNYRPPALPDSEEPAPRTEFILGFDNPTAQEQKGFLEGVFELVLVELENIPFVCVRFVRSVNKGGRLVQTESIPWQECPVHPVAAEGYVPDAPIDPARWVLSAVLVDCISQKVKGIRVVTLSNEFCREFSLAMARHRDDYSDMHAYMSKLQGVYERVPVGVTVKRGKVLAHCLGGD